MNKKDPKYFIPKTKKTKKKKNKTKQTNKQTNKPKNEYERT